MMLNQRELGWCPGEKPQISWGRWEWGKRRGGQERAAGTSSRHVSLFETQSLQEGVLERKAFW